MHPLRCVLQVQRLSAPFTSMCWVLLRTCRAQSSVSSTPCPSPEAKSSEAQKDFSSRLATGPTFQHFLRSASVPQEKPSSPEVEDPPPYLSGDELLGRQRKVYLETYGCQMNVNDTEIAWSILQKSGYLRTSNLQEGEGRADHLEPLTSAQSPEDKAATLSSTSEDWDSRLHG